ncbi:hypothetical protein GCM10007036_15420 [Alsobacter metallidurans]|uniref:Uncharacterized protein n=1 Tax=Alsobacter metallidurans TaxID=340221 RepID=A0A917I6F8_9HYPH|nr:hypothetical protein [Alsobacter metallidurans]GGH15408.1 hypothetical protein GCM10007036_15420 [Alsobacter metallidurans]
MDKIFAAVAMVACLALVGRGMGMRAMLLSAAAGLILVVAVVGLERAGVF